VSLTNGPLAPIGSPIVVKFVGRVGDTRLLERQVSVVRPVLQRVRFVFDPQARSYDWLAVYDNLPSLAKERFSARVEILPCPQENTILLTSEPSPIKTYGRAFTSQFGHVISSQETWAIRHSRQAYQQGGLRWLYGIGGRHLQTVDEIAAHLPVIKTRHVSIICSAKRNTQALHRKRLMFSMELARLMPELDLFGRGIRPIDDKAEALDPYRYHVVIENYRAPHHWTEKLADAFLGCTLPFYYGAPNAGDYFPEQSFIAIDLKSPSEVARRIRAAIVDNEYAQRMPFILEARRRVIEEYNMISLIAHHVEAFDRRPYEKMGGRILSQRQSRGAHPLLAVQDFCLRAQVTLRNRLPKPADLHA
jgi:hypothetical protein